MHVCFTQIFHWAHHISSVLLFNLLTKSPFQNSQKKQKKIFKKSHDISISNLLLCWKTSFCLLSIEKALDSQSRDHQLDLFTEQGYGNFSRNNSFCKNGFAPCKNYRLIQNWLFGWHWIFLAGQWHTNLELCQWAVARDSWKATCLHLLKKMETIEYIVVLTNWFCKQL